MPRAATISDIQSIARREALQAGKKILGVTASQGRYVQVPDADDPAAVFEFVVDVHLLEGPSQVIIVGAPGGLALVENVLVASSAVGSLVADLFVPVEIERLVTGQLQVVARAKVSLPTLQLDEYSYADLDCEHVSELGADGLDPWGMVVLDSGSDRGASVSVNVSTTPRLSKASELNKDNSGNVIGLGVNKFQRTIIDTVRNFEIEFTERVSVSESEDVQ